MYVLYILGKTGLHGIEIFTEVYLYLFTIIRI